MAKFFNVTDLNPSTEINHSIGSKPALAMLPLSIGAFPFGLAYGVTAQEIMLANGLVSDVIRIESALGVEDMPLARGGALHRGAAIASGTGAGLAIFWRDQEEPHLSTGVVRVA